jgi:PAS domain S-box-containing protein
MDAEFSRNLSDMIGGSAYHRIFEESMETICISSPNGRILDINKAGVELLGYSSKKDLLALGELKNIYQNPKNLEKWQQLMVEQGYVKDFESNLVRKNGEIIAALETSCTLRDETGNAVAYAGIIKDVTRNVRSNMYVHKQYVDLVNSLRDVKKTQPKLIQQEKLASIGQLAAGIAHELNNPIGFISSNFTSLKSYVTIIKKYIYFCEKVASIAKKIGVSPLREHVKALLEFRDRQKLEFIYRDIEDLVNESMDGILRITDIVKSLRNFSRIDTGSEIELYDINEALDSTLIVAKNEIKYVADVVKDFQSVPLIECIGGEINQVLLNIIINAAQAIKSQNRADRGLIKLKTYSDVQAVTCEISDDGPGIRRDLIHRIFDPFFTTKDAGKGIGLGLSISYDIVVNKHKGELFAESNPGELTKFIVKLPVKSRIPALVFDESMYTQSAPAHHTLRDVSVDGHTA